MKGKIKTMTLVEEAEQDRRRQRQIKEYNPAFNSLTIIQDEIFKFFDDSGLADEGKCKFRAQRQERFGFLLIKLKNASPFPAPALPPQPALPLASVDDHGADRPPAAVVVRDKELFFYE